MLIPVSCCSSLCCKTSDEFKAFFFFIKTSISVEEFHEYNSQPGYKR